MNDKKFGERSSQGGDQKIKRCRTVMGTCEKLGGFMSFLMLINLIIGLVCGLLADRRSNSLRKQQQNRRKEDSHVG